MAIAVVGVYLNQSTAGWELRTFDLLGWMCIGTGAFLAILSLLGMCAARSGARPMLFAYFLLLLLLLAGLLLAVLFAFLENGRLVAYITDHWDAIQARIGLGDLIGGVDEHLSDEDEQLSLDDVIELLSEYLLVLEIVGGTSVGILATAFLAVMRMLGTRAIVISLLLTLGLLGVAEGGIAYRTLGQVQRATTYLLAGCAGTQLFVCLTGVWGFAWLNRECVCTSCSVLTLATVALGYVAGATYLWLRDSLVTQPDMGLLLVFGIAAVADFFMLCTCLFQLIAYRLKRRAFRERERAGEMREEYSDYDQRDRDYTGDAAVSGRRKNNRKAKPITGREWLPEDGL